MIEHEAPTTPTPWGWLALRVALFLAGASLLVYIPYRYLAGSHPGAVGSLYGTIFPASAMLALAGILLAVKPTACSCAKQPSKAISAAGLTVLAGTWMATGLMCVKSLTATTLASPLQGILETFHMSAQHIFLSLGVVALAWVPHRVAQKVGVPADQPIDALEGADGTVPEHR